MPSSLGLFPRARPRGSDFGEVSLALVPESWIRYIGGTRHTHSCMLARLHYLHSAAPEEETMLSLSPQS
jgi:hypothetical protein